MMPEKEPVIRKLVEECNLNLRRQADHQQAPEGKLNDGIKEEIEIQGLTLIGVVPQDADVYEYDCEGKPTTQLPKDSPVRKALYEILDGLDIC